MRREHAVAVCELKKRYSTLLEAGRVARTLREKGTTPHEKSQVPYLCPYTDHYHIGRNIGGVRYIRDILYRLRLNLKVSASDLEFAGA